MTEAAAPAGYSPKNLKFAGKVAGLSGDPDTIEKEDLRKTGLAQDKITEALTFDGNRDGLAPEEFLDFIHAQANPFTLEVNGRSYRVQNGKIEPSDAYINKIIIKLNQLLRSSGKRIHAGRIGDYEGFMEWFKGILNKNNGRIVIDDDFREEFARQLRIPEKDITEAALDALFGDQNGELDEEDIISVPLFMERLDLAIKFFAVRKQLGEGFVGFLRRKRIAILNFGELQKRSAQYNVFYAIMQNRVAYDEFKNRYLGLAGEAWKDLARIEGRADQYQERAEIITKIWKGDKKIPQELQELLFFTYLTDFEISCLKSEIKIDGDINWKDPKVLDDFVKGVLMNFVLGRDLPEGEDEITEEIIHQVAKNNEGLLKEIQDKKEEPQGQVAAVPAAPPPPPKNTEN
ncbi:MAG: hypothetical protein V3T21_06895 [Candidatus Margulisiibacteriota bacterium]